MATLNNLSENARKLLRDIHLKPEWTEIRIAFCCHVPEGDAKSGETSIAVAHGKNLGTRYVFNQIEEIVKEKPAPRTIPRTASGRDADLEG